MSKVMVTGATGFVGRYLCDIIEDCVSVVRHSSNCNDSSEIIIQDFNESVCWGKLIPRDVDCVISLAGVAHGSNITNEVYHSVNTVATLHLAREITKLGVKRFVFVSSIGVNGRLTNAEPFTFNSITNPHNDYAKSKYEAELGLRKIAEETGLEVVIVRPTLVYGPNAPGSFGLLTKLVKKFPILPFGLAENRRNFIAVQNLADLLMTCAIHPNAGGHTFLARDRETVSIKEFTTAIANGLGKKVIQLPIPVNLMRFTGKLIGISALFDQLFGNLEVDSKNIQQVLHWVPPLTMEQAMGLLHDSDE